jgi:hypothetical protein
MSFLSGIMKSIINPATLVQLAMGPAGWVSLAVKTVISAVGQQIIQQLGQKLGLPQPMIDMAKTAFTGAMGGAGANQGLGQALQGLGVGLGASATDIGNAERDLNTGIMNAANTLAERSPGRSAPTSAKGGWLMAIAEAMGKQLDAKGAQLTEMAGQITDKTPSLTTKFQAASQEFGLMMNALTTVLKTIGENVTASARKG